VRAVARHVNSPKDFRPRKERAPNFGWGKKLGGISTVQSVGTLYDRTVWGMRRRTVAKASVRNHSSNPPPSEGSWASDRKNKEEERGKGNSMCYKKLGCGRDSGKPITTKGNRKRGQAASVDWGHAIGRRAEITNFREVSRGRQRRNLSRPKEKYISPQHEEERICLFRGSGGRARFSLKGRIRSSASPNSHDSKQKRCRLIKGQ